MASSKNPTQAPNVPGSLAGIAACHAGPQQSVALLLWLQVWVGDWEALRAAVTLPAQLLPCMLAHPLGLAMSTESMLTWPAPRLLIVFLWA